MEKTSNPKHHRRFPKKVSKKARAMEIDYFANKTFHFRPEKPIPIPIFIEKSTSANGNTAFLRATLASLIHEAEDVLAIL